MQIVFLAFVGLVFGAILGAVAGVGVGAAWVSIFHVSDFEGGAGMMVFLTFMPLGLIVGGIAGAIVLGRAAARP